MSSKTTVLVVDDDAVVRLSFLRALSGDSCTVDTAADAESALAAMEGQRFDVVLLDLRMPGIGGMSALRAIKQRWPDSEVVIITGYPTVETAKEAVRLGAYDYLAKPVGPADVIGVTDAAATRKRWALQPAM